MTYDLHNTPRRTSVLRPLSTTHFPPSPYQSTTALENWTGLPPFPCSRGDFVLFIVERHHIKAPPRWKIGLACLLFLAAVVTLCFSSWSVLSTMGLDSPFGRCDLSPTSVAALQC